MAPTILRVKRKRAADPVDALVLACKRVRPESDAEIAGADAVGADIQSAVFKLAATVASKDASVQKQIREALSRERAAQALRPSLQSSQRILEQARIAKRNARQESRYLVLANHRTGIVSEELKHYDDKAEETDAKAEKSSRKADDPVQDKPDFQIFDIVQEGDEEDTSVPFSTDPETILCNSVKMIREKLTLSDENTKKETGDNVKEDEYVYDIYYQESTAPGWIQDILSVRPYYEENELVPEEDPQILEVYEDEDDENDEGNWRNDYPDEEEYSEGEERYSDFSDSSFDEDGNRHYRYGWRSWDKYQNDIMQDLKHLDEGGTYESD
ncbi:probable RNA polymerase II nuclear localization protein SLC7A6OS [Erpetoichthys calabaricus]|uniref:probable RNA polymerase II nuclear localization protein SLC7A6OS n=1 Tax=Erpetoichthys calabaricus TaxID=27687 RepID=UPI002234E035|nr:probable RNA polymerase II nuclear localization protein SLC7A6OS [Erpetoichthys calabaricus]